MDDNYVSEELLKEIPQSLINFLWYLWDVYCDPGSEASLLLLQAEDGGQRVTIHPEIMTVKQDFGTTITATILIRKKGSKYYMSRR